MNRFWGFPKKGNHQLDRFSKARSITQGPCQERTDRKFRRFGAMPICQVEARLRVSSLTWFQQIDKQSSFRVLLVVPYLPHSFQASYFLKEKNWETAGF